jgi:replication initiation and membrane attachment protein DnaB
VIILIGRTTTKLGNSLEVRKQNVCIYKVTISITTRNVKVMIIIKSIYWSAWQQLRDKLQASTGERKQTNVEDMNKRKQRWIEINKECNNEELHNNNNSIQFNSYLFTC